MSITDSLFHGREVEFDLSIVQRWAVIWQHRRVGHLCWNAVVLGRLANLQCGMQTAGADDMRGLHVDAVLLDLVSHGGDDARLVVIEEMARAELLDIVMILGAGGCVDNESQ